MRKLDFNALGYRLRVFRMQSNLSQAELAGLAFPNITIKASRQRLGRIERGDTIPADTEVMAIARALSQTLNSSEIAICDSLYGSHEISTAQAWDQLYIIEESLRAILLYQDQLTKEQAKLVDGMVQSIEVLTRFLKEQAKAIKQQSIKTWVSAQRLGEQMLQLLSLVPVESLISEFEVRKLHDAVRFLVQVQDETPINNSLETELALAIMTYWFDSLQMGDKVLAVSYTEPNESWLSPDWNSYREANIRASDRGVSITRIMVFDREEDLLINRKTLDEQYRAGIKILTVESESFRSPILDVIVFVGQITCILNCGHRNRIPHSVDFIPVGVGSAYRSLINEYWNLLLTQASLYCPETNS